MGNSVTSIGYEAFYSCIYLKSVTMGNSVTSIGDFAFRNCSSLTSVTIPNSVTYIGYSAFAFCSSLTSVTIPNSVTFIGTHAFYRCISLTSITIPDSVTSIGDYEFAYCNSLTSITIPDSVTSIGDRAFYNIGLTLPKRYTEDGRLIAYKAFNADMTCRDFQYEEGKTYELEGEIECCEYVFHACTNPLDVFNYYRGTIGKDIVIHEVYLSGDIDGDIDEDNKDDSKVCASKIEIGRSLTIKDINDIITTSSL
jgi:hypothetical protein